DPPLGRVGSGRPDDAVALLGSAVLVEAHRAAEPHHAAGRAGLDDPVVLDDLLQLLDPALDEALLVLGRVILEVLGEIAELARALDLLDDVRPPDPGQLIQLGPDRREPFGRYVYLRSHFASLLAPS